MKYYRRQWEQTRGDQFNHWGTADYYFETDDGGVVHRQVEVYANGRILRYDRGHRDDEYGQLTDRLLDLSEFQPYASERAAFDAVWPPGTAAGLASA